GERLGKDVVERRLLARQALLPLRRLLREGLGRERLELLLEPVDLLDDRPEPPEDALVGAPKDARQEARHGEQRIVRVGPGEVKLPRAGSTPPARDTLPSAFPAPRRRAAPAAPHAPDRSPARAGTPPPPPHDGRTPSARCRGCSTARDSRGRSRSPVG